MTYDLIVIGGGPAGVMAAGRAAERGARVLLLEKNKNLGKKLLITGKGRCNITNAEFDAKKFIQNFGKNGKFLFSALHKFSVQDTIDFFEHQGIETKTERGNRVFPLSDKAQDVLKILLKYLTDNKVEIQTNAEVKAIIKSDNQIDKLILSNNQELQAQNYCLCTGGLSYPTTGSTGQGFEWLKNLGHTIIPPTPSLAPIILQEKWIKDLEGLSLKNVQISLFQNNKKIDSRFGEALFTDNGMSGPIILDMSKKIGELLKNGSVELTIDFKPALDFKTLDGRIQKDFSLQNNKMFKNSLDWLLPKKLIPIIVKLSKISPEKKINSITKVERKMLLHLIKDFRLHIKNLESFELAIITAGGVNLAEVDPKTMQSKIINNLYLAGEVLDLDGPTGGFNLQVAWSTGFTAGDSIDIIDS